MSNEDVAMTIYEVAQLSGATTRTLRWYDELGLVTPDREPSSNYRLYRRKHLKDLQQVFFFRELGLSLQQIKQILKDPQFNRLEALQKQSHLLKERRNRMDEMIRTLELTIREERGDCYMNEEQRFEGIDFSHNPYEDEARQRWGNEKVDEANSRIDELADQQKVDLADTMKNSFIELSALRDTDPASDDAQQAIEKWYQLMNTMGEYTVEMFANLGRMYVDDERFAKNIDKYGEGLARFMRDAMIVFAQRKQ